MFEAIIVDVETTGKRTPNARIIEIGSVVLDSRLQEADHFHILVNPGEEALRNAAPEALRKNGISLEEIRAGVPIEEAAVRCRAFLAKYPEAKIHAFNNEFDKWFLERDPWRVAAESWGECIMVASMEIMNEAGALEIFKKDEPKWPRLDEAAKFFGVPLSGNHRGLPDSRVAAGIYAKIKNYRTSPDSNALSEARNSIEDGM